MDNPQEIEVWYVLPAIRKEIALEMKKKGVKQKDIASILNVTEAAVSMYINSKRAKDVIFPKEIKQIIEKSTSAIIKNQETLLKQTQYILKKVRQCMLLCELHKKYCELPEECCLCVEKSDN